MWCDNMRKNFEPRRDDQYYLGGGKRTQEKSDQKTPPTDLYVELVIFVDKFLQEKILHGFKDGRYWAKHGTLNIPGGTKVSVNPNAPRSMQDNEEIELYVQKLITAANVQIEKFCSHYRVHLHIHKILRKLL